MNLLLRILDKYCELMLFAGAAGFVMGLIVEVMTNG